MTLNEEQAQQLREIFHAMGRAISLVNTDEELDTPDTLSMHDIKSFSNEGLNILGDTV